MIERIEGLPPGVVGLRAHGQVSSDDYQEVVFPLLEEARRNGRRLRMLAQFGDDFDGYTLGAALQDLRVSFQSTRLFERFAVMTDRRWIRAVSRALGSVLPYPVRVFSNAGLAAATDWLAGSATDALPHHMVEDMGVLVIEPQHAIRAEDVEAIEATADAWIETHGSLQGIVVHAREIPGWQNLGAFLRHVQFVRSHHKDIGKVALAADGQLAALAPRVARPLLDPEVAHFAYEDFDRGLAWASASA